LSVVTVPAASKTIAASGGVAVMGLFVDAVATPPQDHRAPRAACADRPPAATNRCPSGWDMN
jgi:hypothetical protein